MTEQDSSMTTDSGTGAVGLGEGDDGHVAGAIAYLNMLEDERAEAMADACLRMLNHNFALRAEVERLKADLAESRHDYEIQSQYVEALKVRVAGLSRDAERYRWLKKEAPDEWDVMRWINDDLQEIIMLSDLDSAIDSAMFGGDA